MTKQFWFYVEPYVHLSCRSNDCLFYNTLTGKALIYWNAPDAAGFARRLSSARNLRVIRLNGSDLRKETISTLVKDVQKHYMGDLLDIAFSSAKPIQMVHRPKIQKDVARLKKEEGRSVGEGELAYLSEVAFYINAACRENCPDCPDYYRQFLCCTRPRQNNDEMTPDVLSGLLSQMEGAQISRINILGGNIFLHSQLHALVEILRTKAGEVVFHLHYSHVAGADVRKAIPDFDAARYHVIVTPPYTRELLKAARDRVFGHEARTKFVYVVQCDEDIRQAKAMAEACRRASYVLKPHFNGRNLDFFRQRVFMDLEDILTARPTQREIYANQVLSRLNFGHLIFLNSGKVHANLNKPALGTWRKESLHQILYKEMNQGKSWRRARHKVKPCRDCVLSALCPPLGNYEFALKRNDLCHVHPKILCNVGVKA